MACCIVSALRPDLTLLLVWQVAALVVLAPGSRWHGLVLPPRAADGGNVDLAPSHSASTSAPPLMLLTAADLQGFCRRQGLAGFKLPRVIFAQRHALPTNASGKVLKHVIRARLEAALKGSPNSKL